MNGTFVRNTQRPVYTASYAIDGKDEIDLIAVDENGKSLVIGEVKRNPEKIDLHTLEEKAAAITAHHKKWTVSYVGLSLSDMEE